jgi:hypothetical protein
MKATWLINASVVTALFIAGQGVLYAASQTPVEKKLEVIELDNLPEIKKEIRWLDMNSDSFIKSFNSQFEQFFSSMSAQDQKQLKKIYLISEHTIKDGSVQNVLNIKAGLNQHSIFGGINKQTGRLRDLSVIFNAESSEHTKKTIINDFIIVCNMLVSSVSQIKPKDSAKIVSELVSSASNNAGSASSKTIGGFKYSAMTSPIVPFMFSVSPAD